MKRRKPLVIGILAILLLVSLPFSTFPSIEEAQRRIAERLAIYIDLGYHFRTNYQQGFLEKGKSAYITLQLYKGNTYIFVAGGSKAANDLGIKVYDENFSLVLDDNNKMNYSEARLQASRSGTYRVKITLNGCTGKGAHWCYITGYK